MTDEDDLAQVTELGRGLPPLDLDDQSAQMIARKARAAVGRPARRRRWLLPLIAGAFVAAYLAWAIAKAIGAVG